MDTQAKIYFENLLTRVAETQALGLHLSAGNPPILKLDVGLKPLAEENILSHTVIKDYLYSFLSDSQQKDLEKNKELTCVASFRSDLRFKINIFYQKNQLSASFRLIPVGLKTLSELGLPELEKLISRLSKGAIIVSGPFGSGKSTVVAGLLETVNNLSAKHIITLEDPIEFIFTNKKSLIEQRQIGADVANFEDGLKFLIEEQVDIIALSDVNSPAIIRLALELAQGGRLVIFQINADSTLKTIEKIISLFPLDEAGLIRNFLSENLSLIINTHLFKKIGGGNLLVPEILIGNPAVRSVIREGKLLQLANILQTSAMEGMVALEKSLNDLVRNNIISPEEARKHNS